MRCHASMSVGHVFQSTDQDERPPFDAKSIKRLPVHRQRRYQRLLLQWVFRKAGRDLSISELKDWTGLDERTVRAEVEALVSTRVAERIRHKKFTTYRLIGQPTSAFAKHLVRLRHTAYTIEQVQTQDGREVFIVQEREPRPDGSYEPVGGLTISKEDFPEFVKSLRFKAEESLGRALEEG